MNNPDKEKGPDKWGSTVFLIVITVGMCGKTAIMFLNEVALGKEKHIKMDDYTLKSAPSGFDSIVAKGWTEPG